MANSEDDRATPQADSYRRAGVDLDAADAALGRIRTLVAGTHNELVLGGVGSFGGLFRLPSGLHDPVLVASTDGVGTKTMVAAALGRYGGVGADLVNHCIDDILVQGARPLFFLDYLASSRLEPDMVAALVSGVAHACRDAGVALLGGETAEMPGVYVEGEFDLAGTIVGVVERERVIDGRAVREGDLLLGLASGGLQTNGFSLARAVLAEHYHERLAGTDETVGEALLAPHRSFLPAIAPLLDAKLVHAMAHITGGGLPGNLPRVLPAGLGAEIAADSWPVPPIFELIQRRGQVSDAEMYRVFNMGVGFVVIVPPDALEEVRARCPEPLYPIGRVVAGGGVRITR